MGILHGYEIARLVVRGSVDPTTQHRCRMRIHLKARARRAAWCQAPRRRGHGRTGRKPWPRRSAGWSGPPGLCWEMVRAAPK